MINPAPRTPSEESRHEHRPLEQVSEHELPLPTTQFRRRAWLEFQRALDPLAPPRPPRQRRH